MTTQTNPEFAKYVKLPYAIRITVDECGGKPCFLAVHPELDGCMAQGNTPAEAVSNLVQAREDYIRALIDMGIPVPMPKALTGIDSVSYESPILRMNMGGESFTVSRVEDEQPNNWPRLLVHRMAMP